MTDEEFAEQAGERERTGRAAPHGFDLEGFLAELKRRETDPVWMARAAEEKAHKEREVRARREEHIHGTVPALPLDVALRIGDGKIDETEPVKRARAWRDALRSDAPNARRWLVLCGAIGVGKSWAAYEQAVEFGDGRASVMRSADLVSVMKTQEGRRRVDLARALVLDDLGTERDPRDSWWAECFGTFVDEREARVTIVTTNLPRAAFRERYDARIIDRLNACAVAYEFSGPSLRTKGAGL